MEKAPENSSVPWVAVMEGLTGVTLDDIIDSLPKGSTPNRPVAQSSNSGFRQGANSRQPANV